MILDIVKADTHTTPSNFIQVVPGFQTTILRRVGLDILTFNKDLHDLAQNMIETMFALNGVGLAGPQVGVGLNIFVMRTEESLTNDESRDALVLINPNLSLTGETYHDIEGCLSIPGLLGRVERHKDLACAYVDTEGNPQTCAVAGLLARIVQHEHDHLNGILFVDKADKYYRPTPKE